MPAVETVRGPVDVAELGSTLMHEHVFVVSTEYVDNYGAGAWWDEEERVADAVARLSELRDRGISAIVDPTVWGLGRYIPRIQRIAEQVPGLTIIVATGLYTYNNIPMQLEYRGPGTIYGGPEPMVTDFTRDIVDGIGATGVKAALLKCCVEAQGRTPGVERVAKVVVGHAGDSNDLDYLMELADTGAILGMDRFGLDVFNPTADRVRTIAALCARGYADRLVLSHDASCYMDWFGPDAGTILAMAPKWNYLHISDDVLPALRALGVTDAQIDQMLVENPKRYFSKAS